jgi:7-carboxy-7-deazaguanine synthase
LQGESSWSGFPCVFVRLTGCNLRCSYCDTQYAYNEGAELAISEIVAQVAEYHCPLVEITGGEPMLQEETPLLISRLLDDEYRVLLETNGSLDVGSIDRRCARIIDVKLPSSGEVQRNHLPNLELLTGRDELKFVIGSREDYEYAMKIMNLVPEVSREKIVINFSPVFSKMAPELLASWIMKDHLAVRLNLQLHKLLWAPDRRGV